ncbi:dipeptide epimerase [Sphingosinicella sp. LHD-64]|uniref:dipeptide epimerase n=1 Tax=Sphingosinicella sp. LHD-64 TaxID=3072139 RepID=UPI00280DA435|nr:dipeptide epimerase [Sphingosinicella sp. LHD-64]MDQ8756601.1 dipeptide epimerase [Sphingosinicella sp. LHD-64]
MTTRTLTVRTEQLRLTVPFRISGYVFEHSDVVVVTIRDGPRSGRGEASGVYYVSDDAPHMLAGIESCRTAIEGGASRHDLQALLPPGGARNALDCALWELEAAQRGVPVWALAGLEAPKPLVTTFTLGADDPETVAAGARRYADARAIKLKLTGEIEADLGRIEAVRTARTDVWLGVDANQGFARRDLDRLVEALVEHRVALLEQPLARGREADLEGYASPVPIAADESALSLADVPGLVGRFDVVNIKLDKCGGLTEGLAMAAEARRLGLQVMVGNMVGTSLAMAPAYLLGQLCDYVDLDGPTFLTEDRQPAVVYRDGFITCGEGVWGGGGRLVA